MIVNALMNLAYELLDIVLFFDISSLPDEVFTYIDSFFEAIASAVGIVANYVPVPYFLKLFGIVIAVDFAVRGYKMLMWIIKKIPLLDIK